MTDKNRLNSQTLKKGKAIFCLSYKDEFATVIYVSNVSLTYSFMFMLIHYTRQQKANMVNDPLSNKYPSNKWYLFYHNKLRPIHWCFNSSFFFFLRWIENRVKMIFFVIYKEKKEKELGSVSAMCLYIVDMLNIIRMYIL